MTNLNEFGVQEMDAREMKNTDGGLAFMATVAAGLIIAAGAAIIDDWDNFKNGLAGESEIVNN